MPWQPCAVSRKAEVSVAENLPRTPNSKRRTRRHPFFPGRVCQTIPIQCKPTQCILCLGDKGLSTEKRLLSFHSHGDMKKHFNRKHLRHHPDHQPIACPHPRCEATLTGKMHLQNHAEVVHKTPTWSSSAFLYWLLLSRSLPDDYLKRKFDEITAFLQKLWFSIECG